MGPPQARVRDFAATGASAEPLPFHGEEIWPEKQWQWSRERALAALAANELVIKKVREKWSVNYKQYLRDADGEERGSKLYSIIESVYTQQGTNELKAILGDGKTFDFPKPPALVERLSKKLRISIPLCWIALLVPAPPVTRCCRQTRWTAAVAALSSSK